MGRYCVSSGEGQPYNGMPVFRITPVTGGGKVRVVHQNLLIPLGGNIEVDSGDMRKIGRMSMILRKASQQTLVTGNQRLKLS